MIRNRVTDKPLEVLARIVWRGSLACSRARETGVAILRIPRGVASETDSVDHLVFNILVALAQVHQ